MHRNMHTGHISLCLTAYTAMHIYKASVSISFKGIGVNVILPHQLVSILSSTFMSMEHSSSSCSCERHLKVLID